MAMLPYALHNSTNSPPSIWQRAAALPVFIAALGLYGLTLAPTVIALFDDSLEFQLITYQLGIAHPTGYPLYTLLGWLFTRLPVGDAAYRINLMSAVFGALTVAMVYLTVLELTPGRWQDDDTSRLWAGAPAALIGALALAVSPVFWSQATVAEVYTLNAAFVAGILWWLVRRRWQERSAHTPSEKWLMIFAFLFGLSLTHHRTMILLLPAIAFYLWPRLVRGQPRPIGAPASSAMTQASRDRRATSLLRIGVKSAIALVAPLLLYLYLPLRGHIGSLDGAYANTLAGFWRHVAASGYGTFIFDNPFGAERGVGFYFSLFLEQFGPVGLAAGLVGLVTLRRRDARSLTAIAFLTYGVFNLFYRVTDIQVFFIPLFLIWAIWVGVCAGWLLAGLGSANTSRPAWLRFPLSLLVVLLFVGQSVILLRDNLPTLDRSDNWTIHDYGLDVMRQPLEPGAAIVGILGETTLVRYFQVAERLRPDLLTVAADQESVRLATVARLLDEGQAVYLTRELKGAPARWSLSAVGPLIRVNPQPVLKAPNMPLPVRAPLTPEIALYGYTTSRPPTHGGPAPLRLILAWQVMAPVPRELKVSARLYPARTTPLARTTPNAESQPVAQADAVPVHFAYPTAAWRPGEFITDVYDLPLPSDLQAGEYTPLIIIYDPAQDAVEVGRLALATVYLP